MKLAIDIDGDFVDRYKVHFNKSGGVYSIDKVQLYSEEEDSWFTFERVQ